MKKKTISIIVLITIVVVSVPSYFWITSMLNNLGNTNQAPIIDSYFPLLNPRINETETQEFNVTAHDPDGDFLTFGWYLNGTNVGGNLTAYIFDANSNPNGTYTVKINITDGYYTVDRVWILIVSNQSISETLIIDHRHAHLEDLKSIPISWINETKKNLNIAYGHTSHGSQLTSGMANLDAFMGGTNTYIFGADGGGDDTKLEFYDYNGGFGGTLTSTTANDLGNPNDDAWASATEEYLDNPVNPGTNVIMWSWCNIGGHNISRYIFHMENLISAYSAGGSKGRTSETEVKFVFMTGHVDGGGIGGTNNLQNEIIRNHCITYNRTLYDFADIESYDPDDNYFLDLNVDDGCYYTGGNWALEWQATHNGVNTEPDGGDWYSCSSAHSQPLNANLKAYASWYLFARLAGWNGN
jgi:hypothetical protein